MATFTQQQRRMLAVSTPFGEDALVLTGFSGREEMSRLFSYRLDMLSADTSLDPTGIVGKDVSWSVSHYDRTPRFFNGVVSRFVAGGLSLGNLRLYRAEVVPWLWMLTRTADCRIFQNKTVPDIIEGIFADFGFTDYQLALKGSYRTWEYCVQYRETAFNFVSRLMEQEGIFYFFRHADGQHTLIVADEQSAYQPCPESSVRHTAGSLAADHLTTWEHQYELRPGKWAQTDYNFETPSKNLLSKVDSVIDLPAAAPFEVFDYPGEYEVRADGDQETKDRMQEEEVAYDTVVGSGQCCTFTPGGTFTLEGSDVETEAGQEYVVVSVQHSANDTSYGPSGRGATYSNTFTCIPSGVPFRAARLTSKPIVQGQQPAVVVGPKGQEIYTDKYGRIKVQFFWDREGKRDENSSCWMRVAQVWAGKRWGASFWPRIGQEVIVGFLEGDPDRPLVIGSVYNADQMPPYLGDGKDPGPDDKHKNDNKVSGFKTNTTPGGKGFNELRFDDTQGKEQVFIHAQNKMDTRVRGSRMTSVGGSYHLTVGGKDKDGNKSGDQNEMVFQDKNLNVKRNHTEQVEGNLMLTVGHGEADDGGKVDIVIEKEKKELIEGASHLHVKMDRSEKVDGGQSLTVGGDQQEKVGKNHLVEAGMELHLKAGMKVIIEAGVQLSLVGPGGFVDIGPAGVTIQGTMVLINSGGAAGTGTAAQPTAPEDAQLAKPAKPAMADDAKTGSKSAPE